MDIHFDLEAELIAQRLALRTPISPDDEGRPSGSPAGGVNPRGVSVGARQHHRRQHRWSRSSDASRSLPRRIP